MKHVHAALDRASSICYGIAALALGGIVVLMIGRILTRNFDLGLAGLQLYAQALGVWMVFIVAGALGWEDSHIEIEYFSDRFPDWIKPIHDVVVDLLNLLMCVVIVAGAVLAMKQFWTGTSPSVNIPMPLYYIPPIVGMTMLGVVYLLDVGAQVNRLLGRTEGE
jgi:TRAP-type C4-dicarboxylate transport system permease small subunit